MASRSACYLSFFFNDTATTEIYTLSLHYALPISDTLTLPTPAMREAMARADVGDDVWEEDPTVRRLEELAARLTGKEAALFVSSGTQGNLVCVLAQTRHGQEVVLDRDSHIFNYEGASAAVFGGVQTLPVATERGFL